MKTITLSQKGQNLLNSLKSELEAKRQQEQDRNNRILDCQVEDTDCFRSIHANQIGQRVTEAKIEILENGGVSTFPRLADLEGNELPAKLVNGRYGMCWRLENGTFVGWSSDKTLQKKGYQVIHVERPAWVAYGENSAIIFEIQENKATI